MWRLRRKSTVVYHENTRKNDETELYGHAALYIWPRYVNWRRFSLFYLKKYKYSGVGLFRSVMWAYHVATSEFDCVTLQGRAESEHEVRTMFVAQLITLSCTILTNFCRKFSAYRARPSHYVQEKNPCGVDARQGSSRKTNEA